MARICVFFFFIVTVPNWVFKIHATASGMKIKFQKNINIYLLCIILGIAIFLRFYNFPYRYSLGEETVRDAVIGIEGARELQLPLTGAFSSLGPMGFVGVYLCYNYSIL